MTIKTSVFIATSLDGMISRPDGSIDWLERANATIPPGEDCGFRAFMSEVDVLIMGRHTFTQVLSFPEWLYGKTPVIVLTHHPDTLPGGWPATVETSQESPPELLARLSQTYKHAYVDGGLTIQGFLSHRLVDMLTITQIPVILGQGRRLFGALDTSLDLQLISTRTYSFGFVQSTYRVIK